MITDTLKTPLPEWLPSLVVAAIGGALVGLAAVMFVLRVFSLEATVATVGTVVEDLKIRSYDRQIPSRVEMQVAYRTSSGREYRLTSTAYGRHPEFPTGSPIPVRYYREHPDDAYIDTFRATWRAPVLIGGVGMLLAMIAGRALWLLRQREIERGRGPTADPFVSALRRPR